MHQFEHPNVLKLTGVCLDGGPAPYIVVPFMANGSLLSYLKLERANLVLDPSDDNSAEDVVSSDMFSLGLSPMHACMLVIFQDDINKKLIDICIQVGKGMDYLASKRVIHRDLAARNCM